MTSYRLSEHCMCVVKTYTQVKYIQAQNKNDKKTNPAYNGYIQQIHYPSFCIGSSDDAGLFLH